MKIMKKPLLFILIFIFIIISSGCGRTLVVEPFLDTNNVDTTIKVINNQSSLLQQVSDQYLKDSSIKFITTEKVYEKVVLEQSLDYFVVDVRAAADYAKGHIEGAVNIPYELAANTNLIANLPKDKTILVICYTGHKAGQTSALWNMLGYNTVVMLNGMSGWTLEGSTLPTTIYNFPLVTTSSAIGTYELPNFQKEEVADIDSLIQSKSKQYLAYAKTPTVNAQNLMADIESTKKYFIVDIRNQENYLKGHIEGAINIPYENVAEPDNLRKLPGNKPIVVAGYNGTDGSQVTRVLNQLGYDSYALLYGMRVWSSNEEIIGVLPISTETVHDYPTVELDFELEGGAPTSAGCS